MRLAIAILALVSGCTYGASFRDCDVRQCAGPEDCPSGFTCDGEGFCRAPGATLSCAAVLGDAAVANTDAAPNTCSGAVTPCTSFTASAACGAQAGCGWTATTCRVIVNCEAVPTASQCENTPGCAIDYTGAGGTWCKPYAPFCSGATSQAQCESKSQCKFGGGCIGTANACTEFTQTAACNAQNGCSWH